MASENMTTTPYKKCIRFTPAIDIVLLREAVAVNPWEDSARWQKVADNTNKAVRNVRNDARSFTDRSVKERLALLLHAFIKEDMASLKRYGSEEEYAEREQLLQEIRDLKDEAEVAKKEKKTEGCKKTKELEAKGEEVRRKAMEGMNKEPTPKKAKFDVAAYLNKKNELEERRIALEEQKLEAANEKGRDLWRLSSS